MISEPELVGGETGIPTYADVVATPEPGSGPPRPRPPWLWALGGALVASALWAGSLYGLQAGDSKPDLQGYQLPDDLCTTATLASLKVRYGKVTPEHRAVRKDPALDRAWCSVRLSERGFDELPDGEVSYSAHLALELHKKVDPEPEFKSNATQSDWFDETEAMEIKEVSGLGERAFFTPESSYGSPQLEVLDGPVVLKIYLSHEYNWSGDEDDSPEPPEPDFNGVRALMIEDMKRLMEDLKR